MVTAVMACIQGILAIIFFAGVAFLAKTVFRKGEDVFWTLWVSIFAAAILAECLCRFFGFGTPEGGRTVTLETALPVKQEKEFFMPAVLYPPNSKMIITYPDNPRKYFDPQHRVFASINRHGFRGMDIAIPKRSAEIIRIALLGDSFTFGEGVKDEDTLARQLEVRLKKTNLALEVINLGRGNADTVTEATYFKQAEPFLLPDIMMVVFFLNDGTKLGTLDPLGKHEVFFPELRAWSRFLNLFFGQIEKWLNHFRLVRHYRSSYTEKGEKWKAARGALVEMSRFAKENKIKFGVAVYPVLYDLSDRYPFKEAHQTIEAFLEEHDIPSVDLLDSFKGQKDVELWVHRTDPHPNEIAQGIAAERLAQFVKKEWGVGLEEPAPGSAESANQAEKPEASAR